MNDSALHTIKQIEAFLTAAATVEFRFENTAAGYAWIQATLARFGYARLCRPHKGILRRDLQAVTGYSRTQVTRLIQGFQKTGRVRRHAGVRHRFCENPLAIRKRARTLPKPNHAPCPSANGANPRPKASPGICVSLFASALALRRVVDSVHQGDLDGKKGVYPLLAQSQRGGGSSHQRRRRSHAVSGGGVRGENQ